MNPYEQAARQAKVSVLVSELDRWSLSAKLDPFADAGAIAAMLRAWGHQPWAKLAVSIGKRPPGAETIALIVEIYESRARVNFAARHGLPARAANEVIR